MNDGMNVGDADADVLVLELVQPDLLSGKRHGRTRLRSNSTGSGVSSKMG